MIHSVQPPAVGHHTAPRSCQLKIVGLVVVVVVKYYESNGFAVLGRALGPADPHGMAMLHLRGVPVQIPYFSFC